MHRRHGEGPRLPVGGGVDLADQPVVVQHRQREVAPPAGGGGLVHLQRVLEAEQLQRPAAVVHEPVERGQQRRPAGPRAVELVGVDPPLPRHALHHRGLAGLAHVVGLHRGLVGPRPGDAERPQPAPVPFALGLLERHHLDVGRVDPLGEVPQPLLAPPPADRHLAPAGQHLQHLGHVAVARPARRGPRDGGGVGQLLGQQRPVGAQPGEHVGGEGLVGGQPLPGLAVLRRLLHARPEQPQVGHRPDAGVQLEQGAVDVQGLPQVLRAVTGPQPGPQHQVGAGRDRGGGVQLQEGEVVHHVEQVGGPVAVQQLRTDGDLPGLLDAQPVHGART